MDCEWLSGIRIKEENFNCESARARVLKREQLSPLITITKPLKKKSGSRNFPFIHRQELENVKSLESRVWGFSCFFLIILGFFLVLYPVLFCFEATRQKCLHEKTFTKPESCLGAFRFENLY